MAIAEIYRDLSDSKEVRLLQSGKTIAENFPDVDRWISYQMICNNRFVTSDYKVFDNDTVIMRRVPFGLDPLSWVLIGIGAVSLGVGIWGGVEGYKARKQAKKAEEELKRLQSNSKDEVINLPYIRGASNTKATGKTQPYILGEHLFTPYILNAGKNYRGFSTISGEDGKDQFYNVVLECGFNKQSLRDVFVDDIHLKKWTDNSIQEGKYNFDSASVFASSDSFLEIAQDGNDFETSEFNQKIIENQIGELLKQRDAEDYEDKIYTLEINSMSADICIMFNGLKAYLEDGTPGAKTRTVIPSYSPDYLHLVAIGDSDPMAHATWKTFYFNQNGELSNTFTRNTLSQIRFNAHVDFSFSDIFNNDGSRKYEEGVAIRVSTPDSKPETGSEYSDCVIQYIHSYCYNSVKTKESLSFEKDRIIGIKEAALSTLMGIKIKSTSANEDKLKSIQIITSGVARTFNSVTRKWSDDKVPTSNPASWILEVLTSDAHIPSQIDDSEIDMESLGDWYEFCERKGFSVNYVITQGMPKSSLFDLILDCGRGSLYQNIYGKISVVYDDVKENAVGVLNEQNLISFSFDKDIGRKADGLKVTFIDAESGYQEKSIIIMYDGSNPDNRSADSIISSVTLNGVTNYRQAVKKAYYLMKIERLRPKKATASIGREGMFFAPLDKFLVQHPVLKIGKGNGEIKNLIINDNDEIIGLKLYDKVNLESVSPYSLIIQCVDEDYVIPREIVVRGGAGLTDTVELITPLSLDADIIPHVGDVFSYGLEVENVTDEMLITSIDVTDKGYTLSLVAYDERIIDDSETIPEYIPDYSVPRKGQTFSNVPTLQDIDNARKDLTNKIDGIVMEASPRYDVLYNSTIIKKTKDGSYSPSSIIAYSRKITGAESSVPYNGIFHIYLNGESEEYIPRSRAGYSGNTLELKITDLLQDRKEINQIKIDFYNSADTVLIDTETIPVLSNSSVYSVILDNNYAAFICDDEGRVSENIIEITPHIYYGLIELPYGADGWEFASAPSHDGFTFNVDSESGKIIAKTINGYKLDDVGNIALNLFIHSSEDTEIHIGFINDDGEEIYIGYVDSGESVEIGYIEPAESGMFTTYFSFSKLSELGLLLKQENDTSSPNYGDMVLNGAKIKVGSIEADKIDVESLMAEILEVKNILRSTGMTLNSTSKGFYFDKDGNARINNLFSDNGNFNNVTVNGKVGAKSFSLSGFTPGDNFAIRLEKSATSLWAGATRWKCVGTGTFKAKIQMGSASGPSTHIATWQIFKNNEVIFTRSFAEGSSQSAEINISVNFGDILKLDTDAIGGRVTGYGFTCDLYTDGNNEFMSLFPPEEDN